MWSCLLLGLTLGRKQPRANDRFSWSTVRTPTIGASSATLRRGGSGGTKCSTRHVTAACSATTGTSIAAAASTTTAIRRGASYVGRGKGEARAKRAPAGPRRWFVTIAPESSEVWSADRTPTLAQAASRLLPGYDLAKGGDNTGTRAAGDQVLRQDAACCGIG